jgi:hypothetical protein
MPTLTDTSPEIAGIVRTRLMALSGAQRFRGAEKTAAAMAPAVMKCCLALA